MYSAVDSQDVGYHVEALHLDSWDFEKVDQELPAHFDFVLQLVAAALQLVASASARGGNTSSDCVEEAEKGLHLVVEAFLE